MRKVVVILRDGKNQVFEIENTDKISKIKESNLVEFKSKDNSLRFLLNMAEIAGFYIRSHK